MSYNVVKYERGLHLINGKRPKREEERIEEKIKIRMGIWLNKMIQNKGENKLERIRKWKLKTRRIILGGYYTLKV